jgi:hypothetical protein
MLVFYSGSSVCRSEWRVSGAVWVRRRGRRAGRGHRWRWCKRGWRRLGHWWWWPGRRGRPGRCAGTGRVAGEEQGAGEAGAGDLVADGVRDGSSACLARWPCAAAGLSCRCRGAGSARFLRRLLLNANRVVPVEDLAEALWGREPPPSARASVQNHVMKLRKALGDGEGRLISTQPGGYLIGLDRSQVDVVPTDREAPAQPDA